MSFIININKDSHRIFLTRLTELRVKPTIIKKFNHEEYLMDTTIHPDYILAKQLQIRLQHRYLDTPII